MFYFTCTILFALYMSHFLWLLTSWFGKNGLNRFPELLTFARQTRKPFFPCFPFGRQFSRCAHCIIQKRPEKETKQRGKREWTEFFPPEKKFNSHTHTQKRFGPSVCFFFVRCHCGLWNKWRILCMCKSSCKAERAVVPLREFAKVGTSWKSGRWLCPTTTITPPEWEKPNNNKKWTLQSSNRNDGVFRQFLSRSLKHDSNRKKKNRSEREREMNGILSRCTSSCVYSIRRVFSFIFCFYCVSYEHKPRYGSNAGTLARLKQYRSE